MSIRKLNSWVWLTAWWCLELQEVGLSWAGGLGGIYCETEPDQYIHRVLNISPGYWVMSCWVSRSGQDRNSWNPVWSPWKHPWPIWSKMLFVSFVLSKELLMSNSTRIADTHENDGPLEGKEIRSMLMLNLKSKTNCNKKKTEALWLTEWKEKFIEVTIACVTFKTD